MPKPFKYSKHEHLPPTRHKADRGIDNTYGLGYEPPLSHLNYLSRFITGYDATKVKHNVFLPTHRRNNRVDMFTIKLSPQFSIMGTDMESLIGLGLVRMQQLEPGTLSLYFETEIID
jgi:hypothetical protein